MSTTAEETEKTTKTELLLDSLEIKGYRCFEHLTIEKLGRVNLIVGKNNVGKTALLEGLWIYAESDSWKQVLEALKDILERRNEKESPVTPNYSANQIQFIPLELTDNVGLHFRHLFTNRPKTNKPTRNNPYFYIDSKKFLPKNQHSDRITIILETHNDEQLITSPNIKNRTFHEKINNLFVKSTGLSSKLLTEIWDDIILKNEEDEAIAALKIIAPQLLDLNFINYPKGVQNRVPVVRTKDIDERVPLSSLGEGMNRLLGLALALVSCKDGILIIDEIEIGLHYSVLPDIWKLIFKTAKDLNVQVFATTHSKDCIEAFAQAAYNSPEVGMLIRLERQGEKIVAKTIEEEMLVDAVNYEVEVR